MTTDCSLNYKFNTWKFHAQNMGENMMCTEIVFEIQNNFCTQHVPPRFKLGIFMYWTCNSMNNLPSYILCVSWCKNKSFWQRFTCNMKTSKDLNATTTAEILGLDFWLDLDNIGSKVLLNIWLWTTFFFTTNGIKYLFSKMFDVRLHKGSCQEPRRRRDNAD